MLDELARMLDHLQPALLDRSRSRLVAAKAEGSTEEDAAVVVFEHATDPDAAVEVVIAPSGAIIAWLGVHEHVDPDDAWEDRPWTVAVVDAVAGILRGEYQVEDMTRLGHWVRSRVIDVADPNGPRTLTTSAPLWGWALHFFPAVVARRRVDYGVAETR